MPTPLLPFAADPWTEATAWLGRAVGGRVRIAVACSGGPDSQALLDWSIEAASVLGLCHLGAIGIDHGLRPEAAAELDVAARLAAARAVPFARRQVTVAATGNRLAAARRARRHALRRWASEHGADWLLLGHTQDDWAELLLWHVLRGSGPVGFEAMPRRRRPFLRPMLHIARAEVLARLQHQAIQYATDPSNACPTRMRARLRQTVWPALEQFAPAAKSRWCAFFSSLQSAVQRERRRVGLRWQTAAFVRFGQPALALAPLARGQQSERTEALRQWLAAHHVRPPVSALARVAREAFALPWDAPLKHGAIAGARLERRQGALCLAFGRQPVAPLPPLPLRWTSLPRVDSADAPKPKDAYRLVCGPHAARFAVWDPPATAALALRTRLQKGRVVGMGAAQMVAFAAEGLHGALRLRQARPGETMAAYGRAGRVRIVEALAAANVPADARPHWPVLTHDDDVIWLIGIRRGNQATIDDCPTGPILLGWARPTAQVASAPDEQRRGRAPVSKSHRRVGRPGRDVLPDLHLGLEQPRRGDPGGLL